VPSDWNRPSRLAYNQDMRKYEKLLAFGAGALLLTGCGLTSGAPSKPSQPKIGYKQHWSSPPKLTINPKAKYTATVHTSDGIFVIQLFASLDPVSVNNFVFLARHHFYNGDKVFRIIQPFMFQTGDPKQNGTGGPGYVFRGKLPPPVAYGPGIVAYANQGSHNLDSNGSQFFVCTSGPDCASMNSPQYAFYPEIGKVIRGMKVVDKIGATPVTTNPATGEDSLPTRPVIIRSVTIQGPS
jgi:cyclophilin family peptidyl-prolyl cis-trans isomerase